MGYAGEGVQSLPTSVEAGCMVVTHSHCMHPNTFPHRDHPLSAYATPATPPATPPDLAVAAGLAEGYSKLDGRARLEQRLREIILHLGPCVWWYGGAAQRYCRSSP